MSATAECVRGGLADGLPANRVLTGMDVRNVLFPWLEPEYMPQDDAAVRELVSHHAVATKIEKLQLRYLVVVAYEENRTGAPIELLLAGVGGSKTVGRASAKVVDLEQACCRSGGSARATGVGGYAHYLIFGVIAFPVTEWPACHGLTDELLKALRPAAPPGGQSRRG